MACRLVILVAGTPLGTVDLQPGRAYVVGRSQPADIVIPHVSVSRRHCEVSREAGGGVRVRDAGSSNGIHANGRRVAEVVLRGGTEISIGGAALRLEADDPAPGRASVLPSADAAGEATDLEGAALGDEAAGRAGPSRPDAHHPTLGRDRVGYALIEKERLALLLETAKSLGQSTNLEELLDRIVDHLFEILPVKRAVIALADGGGGFVPRKVMPLKAGDDLSSVASASIVRSVAETLTGCIVEDAVNDENFNPNESILISNIRAAICAPIVFDGRCLGAIYADYPGRRGLYQPADLDFLTAFASIAAVSLENARMVEELRAQERLRRELEVASDIQQGLLPRQVGEFPGLEVNWTYWPSAEVGGDFVDVFEVEGGRVVALLGDVSGKGVPAAIYMARTLSTLRAALAITQAPGRAMTRTNDLLGQPDGRVLFVTAFIAVIDPGGRSLQWCSAGHNPVLVRDPRSGAIVQLDAQSPPMGVVRDVEYQTGTLALEPGMLVSIYTDGLVEARSADGAEFGLERVRALVDRHADAPPAEMTAAMLAAIERHIDGSTYLRDDVCILNLRIA